MYIKIIFSLLLSLFCLNSSLLSAGTIQQPVQSEQNFKQKKIIKKFIKKIKKPLNNLLTSSWLSAVLGVLGLAFFIGSIAASFSINFAGVIVGIVLAAVSGLAAIVLGRRTLKEIKANGGKGKGLAWLGIITGSLALLLLAFTSVMAFIG